MPTITIDGVSVEVEPGNKHPEYCPEWWRFGSRP